MINFKKLFYFLIGSVYIPEELLNTREKILLHISDTPANFFSVLNFLISKLQPDYIIHSGDLVDNIKLEIYPYRLDEYKKKVPQLIKILENSSAKKIYLALGNHDDEEVVNNITNRSKIIEKSDIINLEDLEIKITHFPDEIKKSSSQYNLFGHDLTINSKIEDDKIYLNGILAINVILLESKRIFTLPYPYGTDDSRLGKFKIGF
ncbi:metallophosphoesterase family protein [Crassaminicella profunda]|uniref:metallophosphoesterase family protein n=1 Tax=Crassaminicella profunda TaxID=1286698 RepID=UPI001CA6177E|nr:metallophosphoesterase family protein [Crassaminicella profunda]QZY56376.1 metallophosphoesterase [Crassaminicella profunda]